ncbi:glycoside hydrolase family 3 protein [Pseudomassariella vexata]|uniref:Beta-glucosidase cel3A n=1 Tax=Pseudomassariella vexata TaxID=1141098 RepID=A0A1Y2EAF5_9PEZI|nr:glycoside hydrolase family 3 protein [Pseudomassariella vexata]ORY68377.1 glycoside hydrolase family 3 protein [Pseudomassariella vexata]
MKLRTTLCFLLPIVKSALSYKTQLHQRDDLASSPPYYPSPWMNPKALGWEEAYKQAKDFVSQLTLPEKVNLTTGTGWQGEQCVGQVGSIPRMNLSALCMQDSPLGVRFGDYSSAFSSGQTIAASFDRDLMRRRGEAIGAEHRGKGVTVMLGPVAGPIGRTPDGGRNWEGFSPDPWLTGEAIAHTIVGVQNAGVVACAKHYIANEQEHFRQVGESQPRGYNITESMSSNIDDKTMHELYLWPFADAVRAGVGSVMCSYNQVNNSYACQNSKLLNGLLKSELGFQGFVMSDWQAQHTGVASAVAGLDMSMPGDTEFSSGKSFWGTNLTLAVLNGTLPEYRLDDMAMRIMAAFFKVGFKVNEQPKINFDSWTLDTFGPLYYSANEGHQQINWHVDVRGENGEHGKLIRESAAKSTVLLKNEGALPLKKPKFLAVIGEDAGPSGWGPNGCDDRGCNAGTLAMGWGSGTANFPYLITPLDALNFRAADDGTRVEAVLNNSATTQIEKLVAQESATALVFVNANSGEGYIDVDGNEGDRKNLTLWANGDELIKNVSSICNNTIVIIHSVGPTLVTDWYNSPNVTAILWAGLPGEESGRSIVDVLYGDVNPAARTPFTWGGKQEDYGAEILSELNNGEGAPQLEFSEGVFIDYRYFDKKNITPIYEFGFGLSYTTFEYSDIAIEKQEVGNYTPTTGETAEAPTFNPGNFSTDLADYLFPNGSFPYISRYIYPYVNTTASAAEASQDPFYGSTAEEFLPSNAIASSPQPLEPAGPGLSDEPGGNPQLWDVLYTVSAKITNTGDLKGDEVPQLYVSFGGPDDPPVVLRGFDRLAVEPGQTVEFRANLTRRDLSNWDTESQNWVVRDHVKTVYVGPSSRKLTLKATLD